MLCTGYFSVFLFKVCYYKYLHSLVKECSELNFADSLPFCSDFEFLNVFLWPQLHKSLFTLMGNSSQEKLLEKRKRERELLKRIVHSFVNTFLPTTFFEECTKRKGNTPNFSTTTRKSGARYAPTIPQLFTFKLVFEQFYWIAVYCEHIGW